MTATKVFKSSELIQEITSYTWNTPKQQLIGIYFMLEHEEDVDLYFTNKNIRASITCDKSDDVWFQLSKKYHVGQELVIQMEISYPNIKDVLQVIYAILINYKINQDAFESDIEDFLFGVNGKAFQTFVDTVTTPAFFTSLEKPLSKAVQKRFVDMLHILELPKRKTLQKKI